MLTRRDLGMVAVAVVAVAVGVWCDLEIPDYMSEMTRLMETPGSTTGEVMDEGKWMLAYAFLSLLASVIAALLCAYVAADFSRTLRVAQFEKVQSFSAAEMSRFSTASLVTRSTNDVNQVQFFMMMGVVILARAPMMAVLAIGKISTKEVEWTMATALTVVAMLALLAVIMRYVVPRFKRIQSMTDDVNRDMRESITGVRVIRAYGAESYQEARSGRSNDALTGNNLSAMRAMALMFPVISAAMNFLTLAIYWIGAVLISEADVPGRIGTFSDMVVFMSYAMQVVAAFLMIVVVMVLMPRAMVSAKRIGEVLDTEPSVRDGEAEDGPETGTIEFRDVSFRYPGAADDAVSNVSFSAAKGETVAIIGPTGSGKTSLVDLVMRFYDATGGQVLVDGRDVREYRLDALRGRIGYVPQKASLFSGTIADNINYGEGSEGRGGEDVRKAADIAQATEFVEKKEKGFDDPVARGGTNLSGGQKQRVSIARAVCRRPEIYVFDDSFSALDYRTDRELRAALKRETAGATVLIVAQRVGTIRHADRIVVLDSGRVVGTGTHEELLRGCGEYREIVYSQMSAQEASE